MSTQRAYVRSWMLLWCNRCCKKGSQGLHWPPKGRTSKTRSINAVPSLRVARCCTMAICRKTYPSISTSLELHQQQTLANRTGLDTSWFCRFVRDALGSHKIGAKKPDLLGFQVVFRGCNSMVTAPQFPKASRCPLWRARLPCRVFKWSLQFSYTKI